MKAETKTHKFKYYREDFLPLPVKLEHMQIYLNFMDEKVEGTNILHIQVLKPLDIIELDARDIEVHSVEYLDNQNLIKIKDHDFDDPRKPEVEFKALEFRYERERNKLVIKLPKQINAGERLSIKCNSTCVPSDSILEGIYKDTTPPGCPQQYMSQCQQWGFQRIMPVFDDCTAKCTYTTTIEADARYTHLISNGNISRRWNPDGKPILKGNITPPRKVITYEQTIPMAPYLFIACAGTWDVLEDEIVYPSGRKVKLEYLTPPGKASDARLPMDILKKAILWIYEMQEYEYPFQTYRTICMEKSNFGGMENVGNTTIVTSSALIDEWTSDRHIKYAYRVIAHEFEHNQCGSDVTMLTPFDMWLNEAFTVDVDRQFMATQFDQTSTRLEDVGAMRAPVGGPLVVEEAGHMGNIVRQGFNHPDELVDGVTYVKAAEVIRMLRLILGDETFREGKNLYFNRYKGGNADTDQFFQCFKEVSGRDLSQFKREWLFTIGYPKVRVTHKYNPTTKQLNITFSQSRIGNGGLFHLPINIAAVSKDGKDIPNTFRTVEVTTERSEITIENILEEPAFISVNRDCSFYGTCEHLTASPLELIAQVKHDPNLFNRVEAMRKLTDIERIKLIKNPDDKISSLWIELFGELIAISDIPDGVKARLLTIEEDTLSREYFVYFRERYLARKRLMQKIATHYTDKLINQFNSINTYTSNKDIALAIEQRQLKAVFLGLLTEANTDVSYELPEKHFHQAWNITDKVSALYCINISNHPNRLAIMEEAYQLWKDHINAYSEYLRIVGSGTHDDVFDLIAKEEKRSTFKLHHPTHHRALYMPMTSNNAVLWSDRGINWIAETIVKLSKLNDVTASRMVGCFQHVAKLTSDLQSKVISALEFMSREIDSKNAPSTAWYVQRYLAGVLSEEKKETNQ